MNNWTPKHIGFAVVALAVLVGIGFLVGQQKVAAPEAPLSDTGIPAVGTPGGAPGATAPTPGASGGTTNPSTPTPTVSQSGFRFVTPQVGEVWAIGGTHSIVWNKTANIAGGLYLVDDKTGKTVGWVIPTMGMNQLTYAWDTVNVSVDRTGGNRTTLAPGTYSLHMTFDGKAAAIASPSFTLVPHGASQVISTFVRLKDMRMTPNAITLTRGAKVVFVSNETKAQKLSGAGMPTFTVPSGGGVYVLETASLAPGTYNFTSDLYTYLSPGTLVVK